jgi:hypothetical protein
MLSAANRLSQLGGRSDQDVPALGRARVHRVMRLTNSRVRGRCSGLSKYADVWQGSRTREGGTARGASPLAMCLPEGAK